MRASDVTKPQIGKSNYILGGEGKIHQILSYILQTSIKRATAEQKDVN